MKGTRFLIRRSATLASQRKADIVLDLIAGKTTTAEVARSHGLTLSELEQWKMEFIAQGTESLRSHPPRSDGAVLKLVSELLLAKVNILQSTSHTPQ